MPAKLLDIIKGLEKISSYFDSLLDPLHNCRQHNLFSAILILGEFLDLKRFDLLINDAPQANASEQA